MNIELPTSDYYFKVAKKEGLQLSILIEQDGGTWQAGFKKDKTHLCLGYGKSPQEALKKALDSSLQNLETIQQIKSQKLPKTKPKRSRVRL